MLSCRLGIQCGSALSSTFLTLPEISRFNNLPLSRGARPELRVKCLQDLRAGKAQEFLGLLSGSAVHSSGYLTQTPGQTRTWPCRPWGGHLDGLCSVGSDSLQPFGLQPARLLCPWDSLARILEWVAISSSRRSSWPRDGTHISCVFCIAGKFFTHWATGKAQDVVVTECISVTSSPFPGATWAHWTSGVPLWWPYLHISMPAFWI